MPAKKTKTTPYRTASKPKQARREPVTIQLDCPVEFGSRIIGQLTINPLKGKHLRRLQTPDSQPMPMAMELLGLLSGQPDEIIDELQADDLMRAVEVVLGFLGGSQATGIKS